MAGSDSTSTSLPLPPSVVTFLFLVDLLLLPLGGLGDCWFLGALAVVATRIDLIKQLIITVRPEHGFYQFRFYKVRQIIHHSGKCLMFSVPPLLLVGLLFLPSLILFQHVNELSSE